MPALAEPPPSIDYRHCADCETAIIPGCEVMDGNALTLCTDCRAERYPPCAHCGDRINTDEMERAPDADTDDTALYCETCVDELFPHCQNCNDREPESDGTEYDGLFYCETCAENELTECESCYECKLNEYIHSDGNTSICNQCYEQNYFTCESCDCITSCDDAHSTDNGVYCESCYDDRFYSCNDCGESIHQDDAVHCDNGIYCDCCAPENCDCCLCEDRNGGRSIRNYTYRPRFIFHGKGPLYLAFEIETANAKHSCSNSDGAEHVTDRSDGFLYCKDDASIGGDGDGFEIVSHPFTFEWLADHPERLAPIFDLPSKGFRSYHKTDCGMHVHISKRAFSSFHLYKFMHFIYGNPDFIASIAGRSDSQWAEMDPEEKLSRMAKKMDGNKRYSAVNLSNDDTVEIRIFRGNLLRAGLYRNLEFVHALFGFTFGARPSDCHRGQFRAYVENHKKHYPNLAKYLGIRVNVKPPKQKSA